MMILLEDDSETLDEVMVVAYGTAKKSTFTGSASLLKSEKIEARPVTSATSGGLFLLILTFWTTLAPLVLFLQILL